MPPIPKPKGKPKPGVKGPENKLPNPAENGPGKPPENRSPNTRPVDNGNPSGNTGKNTGKKSVTKPIPKKHRVGLSNPGLVKLEFLVGLVLLLLAPIGNPDVKMDSGYAKRLIAYCLLFVFLFPMGQSSNAGVSKVASSLGGLFLLTMIVYSPTKGFAVDFVKLINQIVAKLQPKAKPI